MSRLRWMVVVALVALPSSVPGQPRPMTMVDLIEVPIVTDPQLSPDGRQAVYVLAEADWKANRRVSHLWRTSADGTAAVQLTRGAEGETSPRWSPDGELIAFLARRGRDEDVQVHLLPDAGGEARPLTAHETSVSALAWAPDGAAVYFLASDPKTEEERARDEANDDVYRFEEDFQQRHLWRQPVDGGAAERITGGEHSILDYRLSADGRRLVTHRAPSPVLEDGDLTEVWTMDADGSAARRVTDNAIRERGARWSPVDGRILFLARTNERFDTYYNGNLFVVPEDGTEPVLVEATRDLDVTNARWSPDGRTIVVLVNLGVHSQLLRVDPDGGEPEPWTEGDHAIRGWMHEPGLDRHLVTLSQADNPGDVWLLGADGAPVQVTHVHDDLAERFLLPRQERVEWRAADGVLVEGLLYHPADHDERRAAPLVVQTHGGPQASDKFGWTGTNSYVPVLTGMGYAVLKPNYRGSTGYGDTFLRDMVGGYFRHAHTDVLSGVDHLIERGIADGDRLAKMGWSAGGHMTNKIITVTDRFRAAASGPAPPTGSRCTRRATPAASGRRGSGARPGRWTLPPISTGPTRP